MIGEERPNLKGTKRKCCSSLVAVRWMISTKVKFIFWICDIFASNSVSEERCANVDVCRFMCGYTSSHAMGRHPL